MATSVQSDIPLYELTGADCGPVVAALGGISASRHVTSCEDRGRTGWWARVAGHGRALDTRTFRILGVDYVDGGRGADGRPARTVTTFDQADALAAALDEAGVPVLHALVGASYGGMVALAFAERYPERLERLIVIGAAHQSHPMTSALRIVQRRIMELGLASGRTSESLALARALAMTTYRSAAEFDARWGSLAAEEQLAEVASYLEHHGEEFAARFSPHRFLALSESADLHSVTPERITTPTTLVAIEADSIVPRKHLEELAARLNGRATLVDLPSPKGHDGFLTEHAALTPILRDALFASTAS